MRLVVLGQLPLVAEYLTRVLVEPLTLAHMQIGGTATDREVLHSAVLAETVGYDRGVFLVLTHLDLLLVKPDVEAKVSLFKIDNVEFVYQHIRKNSTK